MVQLVVRALIPDKDKLLLVRHKDGDFWCLPGGRVEPHEHLLPALERELKEELGVRPLIGRLVYIYEFHRADEERLEFFFLVTNPADYHSIDLRKTSHGAAELQAAGFYDLKDRKILPEFLAEELPGLLAPEAANTLPQLRIG